VEEEGSKQLGPEGIEVDLSGENGVKFGSIIYLLHFSALVFTKSKPPP
jgi:hypothetical protein